MFVVQAAYAGGDDEAESDGVHLGKRPREVSLKTSGDRIDIEEVPSFDWSSPGADVFRQGFPAIESVTQNGGAFAVRAKVACELFWAVVQADGDGLV